MQVVWGETEDFINSIQSGHYLGKLWQLKYDRLFERVMDNSKILEITGLKQEELMPLYEGLRLEIAKIPQNHVFPDNEAMDEILKKYE
jgi:hypothetical protein